MPAAALTLSTISAATISAAETSAGPPPWLVGVGTFLALCALLLIVTQLNRNR